MQIHVLVERAYNTAQEKGWWDEPRTFLECLALVHSEVSEAVEAWREMPWDEDVEDHDQLWLFTKGGYSNKPEGVASELADVLIRIADLCGRWQIDLEEAVEAKLEYNTLRPYRHGGKRA